MRLFFFSTLILFCYASRAQQSIAIKGVLVDQTNNQPIDHAVCFLKNNVHIGDVTEENGFFRLNYPLSFEYDSLIISSLGYERLELPLSSLNINRDTLFFFLERKALLLDDLIIEAKGYRIKDLILKSFSNIPRNYPKGEHQLTGLYRKLSTQGQLYTHLEEAAIELKDYNYNAAPDKIEIEVQAYRQTNEWGNVDATTTALMDKVSQKAYENFGISINQLNKLYESNYIRLFKQEGTHFDINTLKRFINDSYLFELVDVLISGNDTVFHIAYEDGPFATRVSGNSYLKIRAEDHAIIEFQISQGLKEKYLLNQVLVKFQKIGGRYYPKFIRTVQPRIINPEMDDEEYDISTYWFSEAVETSNFEKKKGNELVRRYDRNDYRNKEYDPDYWQNFELIKMFPLEEAIRRGLEKHQPLEEQFRQNSHD